MSLICPPDRDVSIIKLLCIMSARNARSKIIFLCRGAATIANERIDRNFAAENGKTETVANLSSPT